MVVEQNKFIAKGDNKQEFGYKVKESEAPEPPAELMIYNLCKMFGCLPSDIMQEDYDEIMKMVVIHNTLSEVDEMRGEWEKKKLSVGLGIKLELEKLKLER